MPPEVVVDCAVLVPELLESVACVPEPLLDEYPVPVAGGWLPGWAAPWLEELEELVPVPDWPLPEEAEPEPEVCCPEEVTGEEVTGEEVTCDAAEVNPDVAV